MSSPDPHDIEEFAEDIDNIPPDEASPSGRIGQTSTEQGEGLSDQAVSSGVDEVVAYERRMLIVKGIEGHLLRQEGLKWYEICGSYLNPARAT